MNKPRFPIDQRKQRKQNFSIASKYISLQEENVSGTTTLMEQKGKEEFLNSLLRHDLKSKAIVIESYLDLLKEANLSEKHEKYLEKAARATKEEIELIEQVKDMKESNNENGTMLEINSMLKEIMEEKKARALKKGINLEFEGCNSVIKGSLLLKELFYNLIENSIKHSEADRVKIKVEEKNDEVIVIVEDDGKGIPDGEKNKILQKGYKNGENGGSGMGMYFVDKIAKSYKGEIEVKDSDLGGVKFIVHLRKS